MLCLALMFWDLTEAKKLIGSASTNNRNVNFIDNPSNFAIGKSMNNDQLFHPRGKILYSSENSKFANYLMPKKTFLAQLFFLLPLFIM